MPLEVQLAKRVHPGLSLDVRFSIGVESSILFGDSGAGKSTILRLISGLDRPDEGSVTLNGFVLSNSRSRVRIPLRDRRVGLIFQDDLLFPHLNVEQNVRFGLTPKPGMKFVGSAVRTMIFGPIEEVRSADPTKTHHGTLVRERKLADDRTQEVAELCGIGHLLDRSPSTLSGGERQRVGLARAIAPRPRLLLCDEPFSALDLDARAALIDRLRAVQRAEGIPVLTVTHAVDEAIALGDRLLLLSGGRIVDDGEPMDVLARSRTSGWQSIRNSFQARIIGQDGGATSLQLLGGPTMVVPAFDRPVGSTVAVQVRSDDIVLARGPIGVVSARNVIPGTVDRVVRHGVEAEVVVRTGEIRWVVGVVSGAVESLGLIEGAEVLMIVKSRGCRVLLDERPETESGHR